MFPTLPEPKSDIDAQIKAMLSPSSTKDSVFLARGNESALPNNMPASVSVIRRPAGIFLTTNAHKAAAANNLLWTDDLMGALLGYPQPKSAAMASGNPIALQATNPSGHVVAESAVSPSQIARAIPTLAAQLGGPGNIAAIPLASLLLRRVHAN